MLRCHCTSQYVEDARYSETRAGQSTNYTVQCRLIIRWNIQQTLSPDFPRIILIHIIRSKFYFLGNQVVLELKKLSMGYLD